MNISLLPPGQRPDTVRDVTAPAPKPGRDFARHVAPRSEAPSHAKQDVQESAQDALMATEKLLASKAVVTPLTESTGGAVLYPQSLRVVGYLSMLGRESASMDGVTTSTEEGQVGDSAIGETFVPGTERIVQATQQTPVGSALGGTSAGGRLSSIDGGHDAATPIEVAAASIPTGRRFARRFVRINGGSLLLRDFSLTPEHAKAVLDAFRSIAAGDGHALTRAVINGKPYPLDKKDDHVG